MNFTSSKTNMMAKSIFPIICTCFFLLGFQVSAYAFAPITFNGSCPSGAPWPGGQATMFIDDVTFPPGSQEDLRLQNAMAEWNAVEGSSFQFLVGRDTDGVQAQTNGVTEIHFAPITSSSTLAITFSRSIGCQKIEADITFDSERTWSTSPVDYDNPSGSPFNLELVALHELGHALGLDHENTRLGIMDSLYPSGGSLGHEKQITPYADDRQGVRSFYPASTVETDLAGSAFKRKGASDSGSSGLVETPDFFQAGTVASVEYTVTNLGTTEENFNVGFYLSTNDEISIFDTELLLQGFTLPPGATVTLTAFPTIPVTTTPGLYWLGFFVDPDNFVIEENESNNSQEIPRPLQIGPPPALAISKLGVGSGTVTSIDGLIDCGFDCEEDYAQGTLVHLIAQADPGSIFDGWGGPCSGKGACVFQIGSANVPVTASFSGAACTQDIHEPDNSSLEATTLLPGVSKTHTICSIGDTDWSIFSLTEASGIILETSDSQGDTFMRLFDGALNELDSDNDSGDQTFSRIDRACGTDQTLSAGTYFVQVEEFGNNTTLEDYQLTLNPTPCGNVGAGTTSRVSVDSNGVEGNLESFGPALNETGNIVAFESDAFNLVPNDANQRTDVFVHDRGTNATTRVSVDSNGSEGGASSTSPALSGDGNIVAFESSSINLVENDMNLMTDVFVHDRSSGATTRVSVDSNGVEGNGQSNRPAINGDGLIIVFQSRATNLVLNDTNTAEDIFAHDRLSGTTIRVSVNSQGEQANNDSENPDITPDGRYVVFSSFASNLVENDTNNRGDIFLRDLQTGTTTLVSVNSNGEQSDGGSSHPVLSADARFVAFHSNGKNLDSIGIDDNFVEDVFVHDRQTGVTTRISLDEVGEEGFDESRFPEISDDGQWIAFSSQNDFVANDSNGTGDIFLFDRVNEVMSRVTVNSDGVGANRNSDSLALSGDGQVAAFSSQAFNLVPGDGNDEKDIFVHEIGAAQELLEVDLAGFGAGVVTSVPGGISCPSNCSEIYPRGTFVTLTAQEDPGSIFAGWFGCDGVNGKECTVTLTESKTATVTFNLPIQFHTLLVTIEGTGSGSVINTPGIDCPGDCTEDFQENTGVLLTAFPDSGSTFIGFSGDPDCEDGVVVMDVAKTCTATFALNSVLSVVLTGSGSGTVTSSNPGIQCPGDCSESLPPGTVATLTALADSGSFFISWTGCTPNPSNPLECSVTLTQDIEVSTEFGAVLIPDQVSFVVPSLGIGENGGQIPLLVTRTGVPGGAISVDVTSGDDTATQGNDYSAVSETLVWGPSDFAPKTILVPILNETEEEGAEAFLLTLSNPTGGVVLGAIPSMAVTIVDTDSPPPSLNLAGQWHKQSYSDTRGATFPDWVNGMIEVNEFGSIVGSMLTNSDGFADSIVAGALTLNSDRTVTGWSSLASGMTAVFEGRLDMQQSLMAGVTTGSNNSRGLAIFMKKGEIFSPSDIAGSYYLQSLGDARDVQFPIGVNGELTSDELGNVNGQVLNTEGFTSTFSGSLTLDVDGTVTGNLASPNGPNITSQGAMDEQKTIMSRVFSAPQNSRRVFNILIQRGTGFSMPDLAGTWELFITRDLREFNNPFSVQTTLTLDQAGLVIEGQHRISEGLTLTVTNGSFGFNNEDELVGTWTLDNGVIFNTKGSMDISKTFAATVGTGILGANNIRNMALWIKSSQSVSLDVDGNGAADALTDGMLILRYLFGFKGQGLINGVLALDAGRTTPEEIAEYLDSVREVMLDVDGNGKADAFTDGMLIARFLMSFTGDSLIAGVVDPDGSRTTAPAIQGFLEGFDLK